MCYALSAVNDILSFKSYASDSLFTTSAAFATLSEYDFISVLSVTASPYCTNAAELRRAAASGASAAYSVSPSIFCPELKY